MKTLIVLFVISALVSYLIGSLNFGVILSKIKGDDIREHGSGNAGTTNMLRTYGAFPALLTIFGDMFKVFVATMLVGFVIFKNMVNYAPYMEYDIMTILFLYAGIFCMIGHIFPVFFKFRGGKGVACAGATVFCVDYRVGLILLGVIVIIVLITRYVSLASITAAMAFPLCMFLFYDQNPVITGMSAVFTVIIILTHWQNIVRLVNGEENKISFKKKNK